MRQGENHGLNNLDLFIGLFLDFESFMFIFLCGIMSPIGLMMNIMLFLEMLFDLIVTDMLQNNAKILQNSPRFEPKEYKKFKTKLLKRLFYTLIIFVFLIPLTIFYARHLLLAVVIGILICLFLLLIRNSDLDFLWWLKSDLAHNFKMLKRGIKERKEVG